MRPPSNSNEEVKKGAWTAEEDQKLTDYIDKNGQGSWQLLPKKAGLNRCAKSCRLRWTNYLRPDIKRGNFSPHEDQIIIDLHSVLGNKWSMIASRLPGRTDNEIKNYWNTHLRKRLIQAGIDPKTHQPIVNYPVSFNSDINSLIMNNAHMSPVKTLAKLRILCNILQLLHTANPSPIIPNPSKSLNQFMGALNGAAAAVPYPVLQVSSSIGAVHDQPRIQTEHLQPTFDAIPKLANDGGNKGMVDTITESIVPDQDLCGDQLVLHSDDELAQILDYKDVFGSETSIM